MGTLRSVHLTLTFEPAAVERFVGQPEVRARIQTLAQGWPMWEDGSEVEGTHERFPVSVTHDRVSASWFAMGTDHFLPTRGHALFLLERAAGLAASGMLVLLDDLAGDQDCAVCEAWELADGIVVTRTGSAPAIADFIASIH